MKTWTTTMSVEEDILLVMRKLRRPLTVREITDQVPWRLSTVYRAITNLAGQGKIKSVQRLPTQGRAAHMWERVS
jgi:predicted transcriptional regulator